jgi:uncharacterized protein (TIGR02453 family)
MNNHLDPIVFNFLTTLEQHNERAWFKQNRECYESALKNVEEFVTELIAGISSFDSSIADQEAKRCIFRIYRDVRFSPDKRPYKTHFGAYIAMQGKRSNYAGYYLHLQPAMSAIGGGLWCPETTLLKKIREELYYTPEDMLQIIENKDFKSTFGKLMDIDTMKRPPRNYPADFEHIRLLLYRHFCVQQAVTNTEVLASGFLQKCIKTCESMFPLINYLNTLIKEES